MDRRADPRLVILLPAVAVALATGATPAAAFEPDRPECIAPASPGGGMDAVCRTTANVLMKTGALKSTLYVTNAPGGSGAVAVASVVAKRKGAPELVVASGPGLSFAMASGRTPHRWEDVVPIAQIGAEYGGFFVKAGSRFRSLAELVAALRADPRSVVFAGGSAPGSLDHIKVALLAKGIGVDPTKLVYVPFQSGAEAVTALLGGHVEVAALDLAEGRPHLEAKAVRCLAALSDRRSTHFKDIPTTYELGVKASLPIWRGLYMAPGAPAEAVEFWSATLRRMLERPEWATERDRLGWEPTQRFGDEFRAFLRAEQTSYQVLLKELGFAK